jgi:hypothetical protein
MPGEPVTVERPIHPVAEMTTFEISAYKRNLEHALSLPTLPASCWLPREQLQKQLDAVLAEQDERAHIRRANANA